MFANSSYLQRKSVSSLHECLLRFGPKIDVPHWYSLDMLTIWPEDTLIERIIFEFITRNSIICSLYQTLIECQVVSARMRENFVALYSSG